MAWNDKRWPPRQQTGGPGPNGTGPKGPVLDMTPDGQFVDAPPTPGMPPFGVRVMGISILVAVLAGFAAIALLALWLALQLIPIAIGAGLIAYGVFRFQAWRARSSLGRDGNWLRR